MNGIGSGPACIFAMGAGLVAGVTVARRVLDNPENALLVVDPDQILAIAGAMGGAAGLLADAALTRLMQGVPVSMDDLSISMPVFVGVGALLTLWLDRGVGPHPDAARVGGQALDMAAAAGLVTGELTALAEVAVARALVRLGLAVDPPPQPAG